MPLNPLTMPSVDKDSHGFDGQKCAGKAH